MRILFNKTGFVHSIADFFQVDVYDLDQEFFDKIGGRVMTGTGI